MFTRKKLHPFFYVILVAVFAATYFVVRPYLTAIILAFITAIIFKPIYAYLDKHIGKPTSHTTSSLISVAVVATTIILPLVLLINATIGQIAMLASNLNGQLKSDAVNLENTIETINETLALIPYVTTNISPEQAVQTIQNAIRAGALAIVNNAASIGSSSVDFITNFTIYLVMLYVFVSQQDHILTHIRKLSPLDDDVDDLYISRTLSMMTSMLKGTFLVAMIQGITAGMLLWVTGVPYTFFFTMLMIFLGVVPLFGTGMVSIPIGIIQLATGQVWQGIVVIVGSILIIANIDNVLRPYLVSKDASLSPAMVLVGMLGGLKAFGVMGFLYGPVVLILFVTTLQVYLQHKK